MPIANVNGLNLYYEIHGQGIPLFLIPGLASDSQSWGKIVNDLKPHCLVVTLDNRGAGRTTPQETETSIRNMADDCMELVKYLGFSHVNLLGHSMGGFVALDCAIRYPEMIDNLVLAATSSENSKRNTALFSDMVSTLDSGMDPPIWFRNFFYWIFTPRFFEDEKMVRAAAQLAMEYPYPQSKIAFANQVRAIAEFNCTGKLASVTARTLVVGGKEDLLFPPAECEKIAKAIPGAGFRLIDHAAHSIHMENPGGFSDCVRDFILSRP